MSNDLDSILSGNSSAAPEANEQEQVTQVQAEGEGQQQEQQSEAEQQGDQQGQQRMVPHEALHAEKQKTKRYTEEVTSLRQEIADRDAAWERRIAQLIEANKPRQEQQKVDPVDRVLTDPTGLVRDEVSPHFNQINQTLLAFAKDAAIGRFDEATVEQAEAEFIKAMQSGRLDQADYQKVVGSPNRYAAAVQWHKRQQAQAEIGDDPAKYRERLEAEIREKLLAEMNGGQQQTQQRQAPVMPSNLAGARNVGVRSGPAWSGPAPLQDIFDRSRASG